MNQLTCSLAYKFVSAMLMLFEINQATGKLRLHTCLPINPPAIRELYVAPPLLLGERGAIDTQDYSYGFSQSGRLVFLTKINPFGTAPLPVLQRRLAKIQSNISSNTAYSMATNWLFAMSIDISRLEKTYSVAVSQHFFYGEKRSKVMLPIFDVFWGKADKPAVIVTLYAPASDLLQLRQNDESYSLRGKGASVSPHYLNLKGSVLTFDTHLELAPKSERVEESPPALTLATTIANLVA